MKLSSVSRTKNQLSVLLERVRQGETVVITDHDRPVAKITTMTSNDAVGLRGDIEWLERNGIVRRGGGGFYTLKPPVVPMQRSSVLSALLDERQTGR